MPAEVVRKGHLKEFVERFDEMVESFYQDRTPRRPSENFRRGPCLYFHQEAIERVREQTNPFSEWLASDQRLHELLYGMLTAWGMNQNSARLVDFSDFRKAISFLASLKALEECRSIHLENLIHAKQPLVEQLFEAMDDSEQARVMVSGPSVVGGSKILHHLLPDLIPPMDRTYTEGTLGWLQDGNRLERTLDDSDGVWHALMFFRKVILEVGAEHIRKRWLNNTKYPMNTSIPKVIDNALIAYYGYLWND